MWLSCTVGGKKSPFQKHLLGPVSGWVSCRWRAYWCLHCGWDGSVSLWLTDLNQWRDKLLTVTKLEPDKSRTTNVVFVASGTVTVGSCGSQWTLTLTTWVIGEVSGVLCIWMENCIFWQLRVDVKQPLACPTNLKEIRWINCSGLWQMSFTWWN